MNKQTHIRIQPLHISELRACNIAFFSRPPMKDAEFKQAAGAISMARSAKCFAFANPFCTFNKV
ncbi:MAG: hypothetical protein M3R27_10315 [Bacteroidota bacterium]|nr:hypothetical protein [Bacteroidota bacterium]